MNFKAKLFNDLFKCVLKNTLIAKNENMRINKSYDKKNEIIGQKILYQIVGIQIKTKQKAN